MEKAFPFDKQTFQNFKPKILAKKKRAWVHFSMNSMEKKRKEKKLKKKNRLKLELIRAESKLLFACEKPFANFQTCTSLFRPSFFANLCNLKNN